MGSPTKIGRYEIIGELGRGAMGIVYRAKDPAIDRVVALKTIISAALASAQGTEFRERFYLEARAAGALAHPGIVSMFDVGEHEGMPYLVMEFVAGRTLAEAAKSGERLSVDRLCEYGGQIGDALAFAHHHGVVHRDIKPANILLTSADGYSSLPRTKISDFGVAKLAEGQTTLTGQMLGTPAFMPPEQFTGGPIDGRSDIFSLGVVLYWLATGERPFPGESITAVSYKVVHTDPIPPIKLNPGLPPKLEDLILQCLAKNPDHRFQNGHELVRELSEIKGRDKAAPRPAPAPKVAPASDPDETRVGTTSWTPAPAGPVNTTVSPAPAMPVERKRGNSSMALVAVLAVLLVAVGGYALFNTLKTPVAEPDPLSAAALNPTPEPEPVETTSPNGTAKAAAAPGIVPTAAGALPTPPPDANAGETKANPNPAASTAAKTLVEFDPKALDRKQNARLEIEANKMPPDLDFTVEMNGKVFARKTGPGIYKENDDLFLPPGIHEFRVIARSGDVEKVSNTVSTEFKANKRSTLRIELRVDGKPANAATPPGLNPGSQIVASLK